MGCGLCVDNRPHSLAEAIQAMGRLPLQEMGKRGREWIAQEFPWSLAALHMGRCYHELLKEQESA